MLRRLAALLALLVFATHAFATINGTCHPLPATPGLTRMSASLVFDPVRGRAVVFGGYSTGTGALDEAMFFDPATGWSIPEVPATRPAARLEAAMGCDPSNDRMILFGGKNVARCRGDVWELRQIGDSISWRPVPRRANRAWCTTLRGIACSSCAATAACRRARTGRSRSVGLSMDGDPPVWSLVATAGTPPAPRAAHSAGYDPVNDRVLMFGDSNFSFCTNQVWSLDLGTSPPTWSRLSPAGTAPTGRYGAVMDLDLAGDRLILRSGFSPATSFLSDAWVLWLDGTPRWDPVATPLEPVARDFAAGYWDSDRQSLVGLGGNSSSGSFGDANELKLDEQPVAVLASLAEVQAANDHVSLTWCVAAPDCAAVCRLAVRESSPWRTLSRRGRTERVPTARRAARPSPGGPWRRTPRAGLASRSKGRS